MKSETFGYYVQDYFTNYLINIRNLSKNTINTYKSSFITFIKFLKIIDVDTSTLLMTDFNIEFILSYIEYLKNNGKSNNTINLRITSLKIFFEYINYKSIDYINLYSKFQSLKLLKKETKIPKYLCDEEIKFILNNAQDIKLRKAYLIFLVLYYGGLRVGELCDLRKENIKILDENNYKINIINSKNNKSRSISFECMYGKILKEYLKLLDEDRYLFINKFNNKYTRKGISYEINKIFLFAKSINKDKTLFILDKINPHMLRHSRAMIMLKNNVSLSEIKYYLGHSHLSTTEIYARIETTFIKDSLVDHAKNIHAKPRYSKTEKSDLEMWLKTNL